MKGIKPVRFEWRNKKIIFPELDYDCVFLKRFPANELMNDKCSLEFGFNLAFGA